MTQSARHDHCAVCDYRDAAGLLIVYTDTGPRRHRTCWTCAHEAYDYYALGLGFRLLRDHRTVTGRHR